MFFDFAAAFPSLAHEFMMAVLEFLDLPQTFCAFVANLYRGNSCKLSAAGDLHAVFGIRAGIRQGCPLSPLLFALCGDLLLRRLRHELPDGDVLRAYADDIGLVTGSIFSSASVFAPLFSEFAMVSGLSLNLAKTVFLPLSDDTLDDFRLELERQLPTWGAVQIRRWAEYLGFVLGPEAGDRTWQKALAQYSKRVELWSQLGLGLHFTTVAYNVYIASLLSFLLQLEVVPVAFRALEASALRRLVPGPAQWILPADLHALRRHYGMPHDFADIADVSLAARFRVAHCEAAAAGGLQVSTAVRRLADLYRRTPFLYRMGRWRQWFLHSYVHNLQEAVEEYSRRGITVAALEVDVSAGASSLRPRAHAPRAAQGIQRAARAALVRAARAHPETRLRQKLERWRLPLFPRLRAQRAARVLLRLRQVVPPRVVAAVLRTWYNGWCTRRRFQGRGKCVFGCSHGADAVEHCIQCTRIHRHGESQLRLLPAPTFADRGVSFMLLDAHSRMPDDVLARRALLLTAAYRLHCRYRRGEPFSDPEVLTRALAQATREAAVGHARAMRALDTTWVASSST